MQKNESPVLRCVGEQKGIRTNWLPVYGTKAWAVFLGVGLKRSSSETNCKRNDSHVKSDDIAL